MADHDAQLREPLEHLALLEQQRGERLLGQIVELVGVRDHLDPRILRHRRMHNQRRVELLRLLVQRPPRLVIDARRKLVAARIRIERGADELKFLHGVFELGDALRHVQAGRLRQVRDAGETLRHPALLGDGVVGRARPFLLNERPLPVEHRHRPRRDELEVDRALIKHLQMPVHGGLHRAIGNLQIVAAGAAKRHQVGRIGAEMRRRRNVAVRADDGLALEHVSPFRRLFEDDAAKLASLVLLAIYDRRDASFARTSA